MRFPPLLLLLLLLAAPLASAAVDPGDREPLEPEGGRTVTAGAIAPETKRLVFGTTDPGDNSPLTPGSGHDEPTWFIFEPDGVNELDAGDVDLVACSDQQGIVGPNEDCSTDVRALATDAEGLRVAAVGFSDSRGLIVTFSPFEGSTVKEEVPSALGLTHFDMDRDGTMVAMTFPTSVNRWGVMHFGWDGATVSRWSEPFELTEQPTDLSVAPDGDSFAVTAGEHYYRFRSTSNEPFRTDNQFIGTGRSVAVAGDAEHISVMGTSSGRLSFHTGTTSNNDQLLNFRRASSPIIATAITADAGTVAWANAAGTFGVGSYDTTNNIFQVLHESSLATSAESVDIAFDRTGGHVAVLVDGDLHLFAVRDGAVHHLWEDDETGQLPAGARVTVSDDGQEILLPRTDGVVVYESIHALDVSGDTPTLIPGQQGQLTLRFRNDGNRLAVTPVAAQAPDGWLVTPAEDEVVVAPGQTVQLLVDVTPAASAEPGARQLSFTTRNRTGGDVTHTVDVQLERVVDWAVGVREGAPQTLSVEAGEPATFRLFVENRGNTPREPPLRLAVDDTDWKATFTAGSGTVQPGATVDLDVQVTPPTGALELEEATVTVRLDGFGDPIDLRAVVGAVFGVELDAPQGIEVQDGGSKQFTITVRNVGNTEDGFRVSFGDLPVGWDGRFSFGLTEVSVKEVLPGDEREVQATLTVPLGEDLDVPFVITLRASSFGDPTNVTQENMFVTVVEVPPEEPDGEDGPGLPLVGLLAAVGVAVVLRRRR